MNYMRSIVWCLYFLVLAPILFGHLIYRKDNYGLHANYIYRYLIGFMSELAIWWIFCTPYVLFFREIPFHWFCYFFVAFISVICVYGFVNLMKLGSWRQLKIRRNGFNITEALCLFILVCIVGIQIFRVVFIRDFEFSDEMAYSSGINDVIYMDHVFTKRAFNGHYGADAFMIRRAVGNWYFFLSCIAYYSGLHGAFICRVLLPTYVLVLFYLITYLLGISVFPNRRQNAIAFIASTACVVEAFWLPNVRFYMIAYPVMWGKTTLAITTIPIILIHMLYISKTKEVKRFGLISFLLGCSAVAFSASSIISVSIELFAIILTNYIIKRNIDKQLIKNCVLCALPLLCAALIYIIHSGGLITYTQ